MPGLVRPIEKKDISTVLKLLTTSQKLYALKQKLGQDEIIQMLMPQDGVVCTWVVENRDSKEVTDFFSLQVKDYKLCQQ